MRPGTSVLAPRYVNVRQLQTEHAPSGHHTSRKDNSCRSSLYDDTTYIMDSHMQDAYDDDDDDLYGDSPSTAPKEVKTEASAQDSVLSPPSAVSATSATSTPLPGLASATPQPQGETTVKQEDAEVKQEDVIEEDEEEEDSDSVRNSTILPFIDSSNCLRILNSSLSAKTA